VNTGSANTRCRSISAHRNDIPAGLSRMLDILEQATHFHA